MVPNLLVSFGNSYSGEVVENLILSPPSKICVDGYTVTSFVTTDLEKHKGLDYNLYTDCLSATGHVTGYLIG